MKWNLRLAAANRGIWKASELQRMLAEAGLVISAGKMSGLWSGNPASIKLDDLDIICAVLGCGVEELLITEPATITRPASDQHGQQAAAPSPGQAARHPQAPRRALAPARVMPGRTRPAPASSCPDCLSWGSSYGSRSYCRACYDFTRRYHRGECAGCRRIIAVKKGHCRLCWLQAGIAAAGRRRITPADFRPGGDQQLSFAGMNRIGHAGPAPRPRRPDVLSQPPWPQGHSCSCASPANPGTSTKPTGSHRPSRPGPAADQAHRRRARRDPRLEHPDHHRDRPGAGRRPGRSAPGDMIAWSGLSPALHSRDLSITRTAEVLDLAGLLHDDRVQLLHLPHAGTAGAPARADGRRCPGLAAHPQRGRAPEPSPQRAHRPDEPQPGPAAAAGMGQALHPSARGHRRRRHHRHRAPVRKPAPPDPHRPALTVPPRQDSRHDLPRSRPRHPRRPAAPDLPPAAPARRDRPGHAAAVTPAARLTLALAAVHAARPKTIRELHLADIDIGNRRLVITGQARPLDDLTRHLLLTWLAHRGRRWPGTANPHLIINQQTAMTTRAVSENWLTESMPRADRHP